MTRRSLMSVVMILAALLAARQLSAQGGITAGGITAGTVKRADPIKASEVPPRMRPRPIPPRGTYQPPRTPWGDPDIAGAYNNSDESGIPFERPDEFAGRRLEEFTPAELEKLTKQRQQRQRHDGEVHGRLLPRFPQFDDRVTVRVAGQQC